ncbi:MULTISPECIES: hypothetical protein [unclassified Acinetobacter]|uniref:hypothetical protein n=1 Tax=unclassified Acinetobacter TaxID=196816 RepID=UPI0035BB1898
MNTSNFKPNQLVFQPDIVAIEYDFLNCSMQIESGEVVKITKDMVQDACSKLLHRCEQSQNLAH